MGDINFYILAREESDSGRTQIANFSFVIDWMETEFSSQPHWRQLVLRDTQADRFLKILAREESDSGRTQIANFSFVIDWMETEFSSQPRWRQLVLRDTQAELGLDVFHQCGRNHYGPTCSTVCLPSPQYSCLSDGTKNCSDDQLNYEHWDTLINTFLSTNNDNSLLETTSGPDSSNNETKSTGPSQKTSASSDSQSSTVAIAVPVALVVLGAATSGAVYVYKRMKGSLRTTKVSPDAGLCREPTTEELVGGKPEQLQARAWDVETSQPDFSPKARDSISSF
ncbi:hypothetical protein EGW08_014516 [Elysia chlorotica]|uniref:Uncharacterized protein n=1 Tax=Elysia chlorotica TaxID=188477 RepID=A0A433T873_ELYCH|nr:hypothetical protein EGW08_014516 [Elysia chlorotica]